MIRSVGMCIATAAGRYPAEAAALFPLNYYNTDPFRKFVSA